MLCPPSEDSEKETKNKQSTKTYKTMTRKEAWADTKREHPDKIILVSDGNLFFSYDEDAERIKRYKSIDEELSRVREETYRTEVQHGKKVDKLMVWGEKEDIDKISAHSQRDGLLAVVRKDGFEVDKPYEDTCRLASDLEDATRKLGAIAYFLSKELCSGTEFCASESSCGKGREVNRLASELMEGILCEYQRHNED